jgi:hypothetical protein
MKRPASLEFPAVIEAGGVIRVSGSLSGEGELKPGERVRVRVMPERFAATMHTLGVADAEVDRIAERQMQSRDQAILFLLAEGVLRRGTFRKPRRGTRR